MRTPHHSAGFTLIEVLVAVLILGMGLLGVAAMQSVSLQSNLGSMERSQAVIGTYAIFDAMRSNPAAARAGTYNIGMTCNTPASADLVTSDLNAWLGVAPDPAVPSPGRGLKGALGASACGQIACAAEVCTVTVRWSDERDRTATQILVTSARI